MKNNTRRTFFSTKATIIFLSSIVILGGGVFIHNAHAQVPVLSQTSITVGISQSGTVTSENGTDVYLGLNSSPTVATVSINGTQVTVTGQGLGSTTMRLCGRHGFGSHKPVRHIQMSGISFSQRKPA